MSESVEFYQRLLQLQRDIKAYVSTTPLALSQGEVSNRLRQGIPLLKWDALSLDWAALQSLFQSITNVADKYFEVVSGDLENLRGIASNVSFLKEATKAWYDGQPLLPLITTYSFSASEDLLTAVLHSTIKPFLTAHSEVLIRLVDQELWRRGYCPVCGGKPDLAFLDRERGARWLLCSRCDAQWLFQRLQCPYCGTQDQDSLSYLSDEEGVYRVYLCDECHSYLKAVDLRKKAGEITPRAERAETLDLDRQARLRGYKSPGACLGYRP